MSWGSNGCWPGGEEEADAPHAAGATDPGTAGKEDAGGRSYPNVPRATPSRDDAHGSRGATPRVLSEQ